jgi:hypothetical protein
LHICPCLYKDGLGCVAASMPAVLTDDGFASPSGGEIALMVKARRTGKVALLPMDVAKSA